MVLATVKTVKSWDLQQVQTLFLYFIIVLYRNRAMRFNMVLATVKTVKSWDLQQVQTLFLYFIKVSTSLFVCM